MRLQPAFDFWIVREPLGLPFHQLSGLGFHRMGVAKSVDKNIPCFRCHSNSPFGFFYEMPFERRQRRCGLPVPIQGEVAQKSRALAVARGNTAPRRAGPGEVALYAFL